MFSWDKSQILWRNSAHGSFLSIFYLLSSNSKIQNTSVVSRDLCRTTISFQYLYTFDLFSQEDRSRSADNLNNINKTHEKMKHDNKGIWNWNFEQEIEMICIWSTITWSSEFNQNFSIRVSFSVSSYFKNKLKGLYNTAIADAKGEIEWVFPFTLIIIELL